MGLRERERERERGGGAASQLGAVARLVLFIALLDATWPF